MGETMLCAVCETDVGPPLAAGRPRVYCGDVCRRVAEHRLRLLSRRLDKNETELRELGAGGGFWSPVERRQRSRLLKAWLVEDRAELAKLLGQSDPKTIKNNQKTIKDA